MNTIKIESAQQWVFCEKHGVWHALIAMPVQEQMKHAEKFPRLLELKRQGGSKR